VPDLAVLDHATVLAAVSPEAAIEATRAGFLRHHRGEWTMPSKIYVQSPPYGDFRAMPALGGGFALLKWITSFPANLAKGMPTVNGVVCLSDARTGLPLALLDAPAVTALRTGAVAAVASLALARPEARTVGLVGCGLNGAWVARCMAAAGYGPGVCCDPREEAAATLAEELGWAVSDRAAALSCDVVCCVTPGAELIVDEAHLRVGQHFNMLGADGSGKAEATLDAITRCELYCDEWEQASHGGELAGAVASGLLVREQVTPLGAVLAGDAPGRSTPEAVTLFDSTGLAIQDLAVSIAALQAARDGVVQAGTLRL
jgi:ornithine cyclodeaminase/alanine dehydrogenase-like protein (mu-crystallin family)